MTRLLYCPLCGRRLDIHATWSNDEKYAEVAASCPEHGAMIVEYTHLHN